MRLPMIAALLLSGPAFAQPAPATTARPATTAADPNQMICRSVNRLGTRLGRERVCRTRAEWEQMRRDNRQGLDRMQSNRATSGQ